MKWYAGIGSRETPPDIIILMRRIGIALGNEGYGLRSGGAPGADSAFEDGCDQVNGKKEIYIPWDKFQDRVHTPGYGIFNYMRMPKALRDKAQDSVARYHPGFNRMSQAVLKLHARNYLQVFGQENLPISFAICWTRDGQGGGGTGQAIRLCIANKIKAFDLAIDSDRERIEKWLLQLSQ